MVSFCFHASSVKAHGVSYCCRLRFETCGRGLARRLKKERRETRSLLVQEVVVAQRVKQGRLAGC